MKFGFDLDGTIISAAKQFREMIKCLYNGGNEIYIISGLDENMDNEESLIFKRQQLGAIGIDLEWIKEIKVIDPPLDVNKAEYCKNNNIDFLFENDLYNSCSCSKVCPTFLSIRELQA